jgi:hypothetical protein
MTQPTQGSFKRDQGFIAAAEAARAQRAGQYPEEWNQLPRTRKEAQQLGNTLYFGAQPCRNGHVAPRQASKGVCVDCHKVCRDERQASGKIRAYYAEKMATDPAFRQRKSEQSKRHYHNVMKHDAERMARRYDRASEYQRENREAARRNRRAFNARNPGYGREHVAARRAKIRHSDLTPFEQAQVKAIYKLRALLSRQTGIEFHVDHHIPLAKGGLHHPDNLWVITAEENLRKHVKLPKVA